LSDGDGRDPKRLEFLNRTARLNNASKITKPLFVVQGGNDPRVPLSESEQMIDSVRKNGTPVWYLMAKDEGARFSRRKRIAISCFTQLSSSSKSIY
jgi:dipeptidyl aminopeptidase/acylaminoacyl peptidase